MEVAGAQVRVTASDRTDTVVLVEPIDAASRMDVKVAEKTKVDFAGGRLSVKTTVSGDKDGSVAITIDLPTGSSLVAYGAALGRSGRRRVRRVRAAHGIGPGPGRPRQHAAGERRVR
ncbi:hypothetical protein ABZ591_22720 [Micromonospora fulviviridis]|uniref:hypothetical protein n=1 Tax=Micromonospora fulviviridis TaxID=47860 RepID=UPI0033E51075